MGRKQYRSTIDSPYRWRDWAADPQGVTGPELLAFINQEEARRPDGKKGLGLFAYLRSLRAANGKGDRRTVVASVFNGVINRMTSGYLLRDVVNRINDIHFTTQEELFTLGTLYESMLKEMRDAAGDSGEFYTPRAVVRFMVEMTDPQLGETVLDPACGTGGFLVEAYTHLAKQAATVADRRTLQEKSILGGEAKPLPYLLGQMNLLLHGLESPQIDPENSLRFPLNEIGDRDRVDVIFDQSALRRRRGTRHLGELSRGYADLRNGAPLPATQLCASYGGPATGANAAAGPRSSCRTARSSATAFARGSRPNSCKTSIYIRSFACRTARSLPIPPSRPIFCSSSGADPTKTIWYYEMPLPEGRKNYSKTKPIQFEEFADLHRLVEEKRKENDRAWKVKASELIVKDESGAVASVNLDVKNPNAAEALEHLPPEKLVEDILAKELRIVEIMKEIKKVLAGGGK